MENIKWLGHASFIFIDVLSGKKIYYADPFDLPRRQAGFKERALEKADLVFITHAHQDHASPSNLAKILKAETVVAAPLDCFEMFGLAEEQKHAVKPHKSYNLKCFKFQTIPAYDLNKSFHPKESGCVGYIFELNG